MANPPTFSNVKLLCHFDGTNGQTTTTDSSSSARVMSRVASALSTTQAKFGASSATSAAVVTGWTTPDTSDWALGSGQFTMEAWVYFTSAPGSNVQGVIEQWAASQQSFYFGMVLGSLALYYSTNGADNPNVGAAWTPTLNTWYHIAVDRDASNVLRVYLDGAVHASATVTATFFDSTAVLSIAGGSSFGGIVGYVDEVRVVKGEAVYGGAFTPPTAAFPGPTITADTTESGTADSAVAAVTTFPVSCTESATSDTATDSVILRQADVTESTTSSDSTSALSAAVASGAESATASDTSTSVSAYVDSTSETASASEAVSANTAYVIACTESASSTEVSDGVTSYSVTSVESVSATDSHNALLSAGPVITENATASEQVACSATYAILGAATADDSESATQTTSRSISEAATAANTVSVGKLTKPAIVEAATAAATQSATKSTTASRTEAAAASDNDTSTTKVKIVSKSQTESANATATQARGPYTTTATQVNNTGAAAVSSASYIGQVEVSTEAIVADEVSDSTAFMYIQAEDEVAAAIDEVDAVNDAISDLAESISASDDSSFSWETGGDAVEVAVSIDDQSATWAGTLDTIEAAFAIDFLDATTASAPLSTHHESAEALDVCEATRTVNALMEEPTDNLTEAVDTVSSGAEIFAEITEDDTSAEDQSATLLGIGRQSESVNLTDLCEASVHFAATIVEEVIADHQDGVTGMFIAISTEAGTAISAESSVVTLEVAIAEHLTALATQNRFLRRKPSPANVLVLDSQERVLLLPECSRVLDIEGNRILDE